MEFPVSTTVTLRSGVWTATFPAHAVATVIVTPDDREIGIDDISYPDLGMLWTPEFDETIRAALQQQATLRISASLNLPDILELANVHTKDDSWRIANPQVLGWVNGLEDNYNGLLLATNGVLGVTRTETLEFKLHQMSHWAKRKSGLKGSPRAEKEAGPTEADVWAMAERMGLV